MGGRSAERRLFKSSVIASLLTASLAATLFISSGVQGVSAAAPAATLSRYMGTASTVTHYNLGCDRARKKVGGPLVLIYGKPILFNGQQGVALYGGTNIAVTTLISPAEQFVQGYRDCAISAPLLILVLATTNCGNGASGSGCGGDYVTNSHGVAWANMVNAVANWVNSRGYQLLVSVSGGSDIEPSWDSVASTRAWVDGYASVATRSMYNAGAADGCPQTGNGGTNGACNFGWHMSDIVYVSWISAPALPLPQQYTENGAQANQWKQLKLYGIVSLGRTMGIQGTLTQWMACNEDPGRKTYCQNTNTFNSPSQGWAQLQNALNSDSRTTQTVSYSTDISWLH